MTPSYRLHYAPDNASLIIRLALIELGQRFETVLVDRRGGALDGAAYRRLNPHGLIPVLETENGALFETGAILLWLSDRHGALAPGVDHPGRAWVLKWLFFVSNTLHADLRVLFYPHKYIGADPTHQDALYEGISSRLKTHLARIEAAAAESTGWLAAQNPSILDLYLACLMRWMALYPEGRKRNWFELADTPRLAEMLARLEERPSVVQAQQAEGLGMTPFTSPSPAQPPEGSAT